jgi:hypothetical protein
MNYYETKFAREAKENPTEWIIAPNGRGGYRLIEIPQAVKKDSTRPQLKLVINNG